MLSFSEAPIQISYIEFWCTCFRVLLGADCMLMRTLHRVVHVRHSMLIYVDDILATLDASSSPIYASMILF